MHPDDAVPAVFLSYASSDRDQALRVRAAFQQRGIRVLMDIDFVLGALAPISIGHAINSSVFVPLISTGYLDHRFTQLEASSAIMSDRDDMILPILLDDRPAPATNQGRALWTILRSRTYRFADMSDKFFDQLATQLTDKVQRWQQRVVSLSAPVNPGQLTVALIYDWEDSHLADGTAEQCAHAGLTVAHMGAAGAPEAISLVPPEAHLALLWTVAAEGSREVKDAAIRALAARHELLYLIFPDSPPCPAGATFIRLDPAEGASERTERPVGRWIRNRQELRARLTDALRLNDGVPFHLLGDKFCASREAAATSAMAYRMAVYQFPPHDEDRLGAVLAYAAVCRFFGDWRQAADLLDSEPVPDYVAGAASPAALALGAERLSLDFELGRMGTIQSRAKDILSRALAAGEWPLLIAMHRQLGMLAEERGEYRLAREHLDRACHYAEDLLNTSFLADRIPSEPARVALRADSLRELAAAEWRAGDTALALEHLGQASQALGLISDKPVAAYLLGVINYQAARVAYSAERDYEAALGRLQGSYRSLQRFDNPIRLATVLESVVRLQMDFLRERDDSAQDLRATLEKIRRVRHLRGHDYMVARTTKSMGDLEFALGRFTEALEQYGEAGREFNRLGKYPEFAETLRFMAQCDAQLNDPAGAIGMLEAFLAQLDGSDLHALRAEIRAEIARLRQRRVKLGEIVTDMEMTDVGEYSVHDWIASGIVQVPGVPGDGVVLGVGDDGAVLRPGSDEDLIISTDSVPPGLMSAENERTAHYAARFAVVSALSDVIAMGGKPLAMLVNLHLERTTTVAWARDFMRNVAGEAARYGAVIVGGDLRERAQKAVTVTAVGLVRKNEAIIRSGARPGNMVVLTLSSGPGQPFAGLATRWAQELAPSLARDEADLIAGLIARDAIFADLGLPHEIMREIIEKGLANSAIDTSDGILACAQLISDAAGVGIELFPDKLGDLVNADVARLADSLGIAPFLFALNAGFDWEILLTVPKSYKNDLDALNGLPRSGYPRAAVIGEVVRRQPWADEGVRLRTPNGSGAVLRYFTGEKFLSRTYGSHAREWIEFAKDSTRRARS
jgi:thiamine-monophosphate kinase